MTRIDHAAEAMSSTGPEDELFALCHAVLALVEQQRIANLIAVGQLQVTSGMDGTYCPVGDGGAFRALYPQGENSPLAPDIASALGIGGDSDE
jgi:hypothetical protein